jgi:hypothetical protein
MGVMILIPNLNKYDASVLAGLIWLRIGTKSGKHDNSDNKYDNKFSVTCCEFLTG